MPTREKGFVICVENRGAEDLVVRKVYRALHDKDAEATRYVRVIDESGEDYLYPADYFVSSSYRRKRSARGRRLEAPLRGGARRTSRFSGPALALLAPAAERQRSANIEYETNADSLKGGTSC